MGKLNKLFLFTLGWLMLSCPLFSQLPPFQVQPAYMGNGTTFIDVVSYGADPTGVADSTAAIRGCISIFSLNLAPTGVSGECFFPSGTYKITSPLVVGGMNATTLSLVGVKGASIISYQGPSTPTALILWADSVNPVIEGLDFLTNGNTTFSAIHLAATNALSTTLGTAVSSPGSVTVTPASMTGIAQGTLLPIDAGTAEAELVYTTAVTGSTFTAVFAKTHSSSAVVGGGPTTQGVILRDNYISVSGLGNGIAIGTGTSSQTSEIKIYDNDLRGGAGSGSGIILEDGNNVGNIWTYRNRYFQWDTGANFSFNSFVSTIDASNFEGDVTADIKYGYQGMLNVRGCYSEPTTTTQFVVGEGGSGAIGIHLENNRVAWAGASPTYVMGNLAGQVSLINNQFITVSPTVAKVQIGNPLYSGTTTVFSQGNFFGYAATWAPFYDGGNNAILPIYYNSQPVNVQSIGDFGGTTSAPTYLSNYTAIGKVASQSATAIPTTGILGCGDTDTCVAFRNHANTGDINGLSKATTDIVTVGDLPGITVPGPQTTGAVSTPAVTTYQLSTPVVNAPQSGSVLGAGTLNHSTTYCYRVSALDGAGGETLAWSPEHCITTGAGADTYAVIHTWANVPGAKAYNVYGRTTGAELLMTPTPIPNTQTVFFAGFGTFVVYTDTGSATPSGALPSSNTTGAITAAGAVTSGANGFCITGQSCQTSWPLTGATGTITGTSLSSTCDSGTASVTGAVVGNPVVVSSTTGADVGGAFYLRGSVTSTGVVTVYVCGTGTPASLAYNVRVQP